MMTAIVGLCEEGTDAATALGFLHSLEPYSARPRDPRLPSLSLLRMAIAGGLAEATLNSRHRHRPVGGGQTTGQHLGAAGRLMDDRDCLAFYLFVVETPSNQIARMLGKPLSNISVHLAQWHLPRRIAVSDIEFFNWQTVFIGNNQY